MDILRTVSLIVNLILLIINAYYFRKINGTLKDLKEENRDWVWALQLFMSEAISINIMIPKTDGALLLC